MPAMSKIKDRKKKKEKRKKKKACCVRSKSFHSLAPE